MTQALETRDQASIIEQALVQGDLKDLTPAQRFSYYSQVCDSLRLNKFTKPFDYLHLNGKVVLYATKNCTDQLRDIHGVSIVGLEHEQSGSLYVVTARAIDKEGRQDSSIGAVPIENLKGEALANAMMKAETKAKRRVTLSLCGLGMLDESEIDSIPDARVVETESIEPVAAPVIPVPRMKQARSLDELVSLYEAKLEAAHEAGVVTEDDLRGWRLPPNPTRDVVIGYGKRLNEIQEKQARDAAVVV